MAAWTRLMHAVQAGLQAYRAFGDDPTPDDIATRYQALLAFWEGSWQAPVLITARGTNDRRTYRNTRLIAKQAESIVNLYELFVYAGDLSTDGEPLPDGSRGAMPIDPQTGSDASDQALVSALHELMKLGNWRQQMSEAPKWSAILGNVLVELVDDYERGRILPRHVPPWDVRDDELELDDVGNVKAYVIEKTIDVQARSAFGRDIPAEHYRYRKEVDGETIRYYKDGRPYDYGQGAVVAHPYGFAPAVWFRHEQRIGSVLGRAAIEKIYYQSLELNSLLSGALDYQMKQFKMPIGVVGSSTLSAAARRGQTVTLRGGVSGAVTELSAEDIDALRRAAAENLDMLPMTDGAQFLTVGFELGGTMEMVDRLLSGIVMEAPEAELSRRLLELSQATGPGIDRLLGPITGKVQGARKQHDPVMTHLFQMWLSMMGYRLNAGDFPAGIVAARRDRFQKFAPYTLDAYDRGLMDFIIPNRPVFEESRDETALYLMQLSQILDTGDPWLMAQAGVPEEEIARITREQERRRAEQLTAFALTTSEDEQEDEAREEPAA